MDINNKSWTSHAEFVILFITLIGGFFLMESNLQSKIERQCERTDRLYEIWVENQKEIKNIQIEIKELMLRK